MKSGFSMHPKLKKKAINTEISKKTCVVIPTKNESKNIKQVLDEALQISKKIIVVDSSEDRTPEIVKQFKDVELLKGSPGKGRQVKIGLEKAKKTGADYIVLLDGDGEKTAFDIPKMIEKMGKRNADACIGSREKMRSGTRNILNRFSRAWICFATGYRIDDPMSGYLVIRPEILSKIRLGSNDFEIETEFVLEFFKHNLKVVQCKVKSPKISPSKLKPIHIIKINNFFDYWIIKNIFYTKAPMYKKILLILFCVIGLVFGSFILGASKLFKKSRLFED